MNAQSYAELLKRLAELQESLASDEQSNRYWARMELAGMLPRINQAISSLLKRAGELEGLLKDAMSVVLFEPNSEASMEMRRKSIVRISAAIDTGLDAALNGDAPQSTGGAAE